MGHAEVFYLRSLRPEERVARYAYLFAYKIPCFVFSRSLKPDKEFLAAAAESGVPIYQTPLVTMKFINKATLELEMMFAPRSSELGCMVDILGVGVLIRGESGVGKSEAVLALIERGYSLVSDDVTKVTLLDGREVIGTCAELTRDHMEIRGIGIINIANLYGLTSIRPYKRLDLVVLLKPGADLNEVDRCGMQKDTFEILGQHVVQVEVPVGPGRDTARMVTIAALDQQLRSLGYNMADEFNERLISHMSTDKPMQSGPHSPRKPLH